jgi:hypothetical protein
MGLRWRSCGWMLEHEYAAEMYLRVIATLRGEDKSELKDEWIRGL